MSKSKLPKDRLEYKDVALWKYMTRDVERAEGAEYVDSIVLDQSIEVFSSVPDVRLRVKEKPDNSINRLKQGLDGRTEVRLKRGKIRPEAKLDLHGLTQPEAYEALQGFIKKSSERKLRCVLVITGKGRTGMTTDDDDWFAPKRGVLRQRVPEWLSERGLCSIVAKFVVAQAKDGGDGALYVYLRRGS